jgi:hypothetical protein
MDYKWEHQEISLIITILSTSEWTGVNMLIQ